MKCDDVLCWLSLAYHNHSLYGLETCNECMGTHRWSLNVPFLSLICSIVFPSAVTSVAFISPQEYLLLMKEWRIYLMKWRRASGGKGLINRKIIGVFIMSCLPSSSRSIVSLLTRPLWLIHELLLQTINVTNFGFLFSWKNKKLVMVRNVSFPFILMFRFYTKTLIVISAFKSCLCSTAFVMFFSLLKTLWLIIRYAPGRGHRNWVTFLKFWDD